MATDKERDKYLQTKWGLSLERFRYIEDSQNGVCLVCGKAPKNGRNLVVDHDHVSKVIRGLICAFCNHYVVGRLTLEKARQVVAYMERVAPGGWGTVPTKPRKRRSRPADREQGRGRAARPSHRSDPVSTVAV